MTIRITRDRAIGHAAATCAITTALLWLRLSEPVSLLAVVADFPVTATGAVVGRYAPVRLPAPLGLALLDLLYWGLLLLPVLLTPWKDNRLGWIALPLAFHHILSIHWIPAFLLLSV